MTGYVPQVGDRVRRDGWQDGDYVEVTAVGRSFLLAVLVRTDMESMYRFTDTDEGPWEPYVEPVVYPERWINVYPNGCYDSTATREQAGRVAANSDLARLGVIHLAADGTLTLEAP